MGLHMPTYPVLKKYVDDTLDGMGALKGDNCTIYSIEPEIRSGIKGNVVTFEWTDNQGTTHQDEMFVADGQTPEITVKKNTATEYILNIKLGANVNFDTPNLKGKDGKDGTPIYPWESGHSYKIGDLVIHANKFYRCISENSDVVWNSQNWVLIGTSGGDGGSLTRDLTTSVSVGGIPVGAEYEEGDSIEDLLHDMLDPTQYPTLTPPSATLSVVGGGSKVIEVETETTKSFSVAFNRGSINPAYGTSGYRSGEATSYALNGGESQAGNTFTDVQVDEEHYEFQVAVAYEAGEQPKDSKGQNYGSPLPSGSVNTNMITFEFTEPFYATTSSASTLTKQPLVSKSAKKIELSLVDQVYEVDYPETFDVPVSYIVTGVYVKNELTDQWEDSIDQFDVTSVTHEFGGNTYSYDRYSCNLPYDLGERNIKVTWA